MATTIRIPELPNEILHSIIEHLPPPALKNARLSSKLFKLLAEPLLFRRMSLVPYADCLKPFSQLMRGNPIAQHVREINYDAQHRYTPDFVPGTSAEGGEAVKRGLRDNGFWGKDDVYLESRLLEECMRHLPLLEIVVVTEFVAASMPRGPIPLQTLPSYFRRISQGTGIDCFTRSEGRTPELRLSAKLAVMAIHFAGVKPTCFQAKNIEHRFFLECGEGLGFKEMPMCKSSFGALKKLDLEFRGGGGHASAHSYTKFGALVGAANNVQRLRIWLPDVKVETWTSILRKQSWLTNMTDLSVHRAHPQPMFPRLTHLSLGCMICCEDELVALIQTHRHSLQKVEMHQMTLIKSSQQDSPPCWVRLLKALRPCRIPITLDGNFTNSYRQWWQINEASAYRQNSLKPHVERWASGQGKDICPIEKAAVTLDADHKEIVPSREEFFIGDYSFRMLRRCHEYVDETDDEDDDYADEDSEFWDSDDFSDYSEAYYGLHSFAEDDSDGSIDWGHDAAVEAALFGM
ncbi:hypothetical protein H2200_001546 [Cladophialophora chaetospira]|uniref:F-box domain-containing protein n=1 Tax=Cladophialophora chaetospira TaxID=386627 RepID=A0AA38XL58_9EURO|nr:hypothetical protein H2200_001546 [Cladophialophora chaetospira]